MAQPPLSTLPIDPLLPQILESLEKHSAAVVTAEPGAGKTTRVPPALLAASFAQDREIWVLQPRRLAAKMAALRVAEELGEGIGRRVGYQFRFEKVAGRETRLKFMTDGMLLPLSQEDPRLSRVAAVVLDEFHERSLELDLGLGFLRRLQLGPRPDLRIIVMSATLDAGELSAYLSACPVFKSEGRTFPVNVEYHPYPQEPDLSLKIRSALRHLAEKGIKGTTLVFLPGLAEIRRCGQALSKGPAEVHALYGDLPVAEQQAVLSPSTGNKVILSTNLAETSLTVPGVTAVVDSGLTRQSRVSTWSGLGSLVTIPASQASAIQRAGRAGRLQEGTCLRLYTKFDFDHRAAYDLPEILRADLSRSLLDLLSLGVEDLEAFPWFSKPSAASLEASLSLLERLGAVQGGKLTPLGRTMAGLPVAPRLAKFLLEAKELSSGDPQLLEKACR
ncbi:MAG TPA: helicase-related protein, partial [bacterium]|nr:helicase-related protein [bacterium]